MAARSSVQGYVQEINLVETTDDRQALNNIGEAPIADDIALFVNNKRNEAVLPVRLNEYDAVSGVITINNQTNEESNQRAAVFTNKDQVSLRAADGTLIQQNLFIKNSNAVDTFGLSQDENLSSDFVFSADQDFEVIRNDEVKFENLQRLSVERSGVAVTVPGEETESSSALDDIDNFNDEFQTIFNVLDISRFQAQSKYVSNEDVATADFLRVEGGVIIRDPSDTITQEGIVPSSPGLYLSDPTSDVNDIDTIRAFSSSSNPWTDDFQGTLSTDSVEVTAGNLILSGGIKLNGVQTVTQTGTVDNSSFTHKVLVQIDGIDYFLCLTGGT